MRKKVDAVLCEQHGHISKSFVDSGKLIGNRYAPIVSLDAHVMIIFGPVSEFVQHNVLMLSQITATESPR